MLNSSIISIYLLDHSGTALPVTQDPQLLYVLRKKCNISNENNVVSLAAGEFYLISSLQQCICNYASNSQVIVLRISHTYLSEQLGDAFVSLRSVSISNDHPLHQELQPLMQQILSSYIASAPIKRFHLQAAYHNLLYLLVKYYSLVDSNAASNVSQPKSERMPSIIRYIHQNYNEPISLQSLAEQFHFSVPYLSKLFKKELGLNFLDYLNQVRVGHAVEDLETTSHAIAQIAFEHGFSSLASFNRAFQDIYGQTPSNYRKNYATTIDTQDCKEVLRQFLSGHPLELQHDTPSLICRVDVSSGHSYCRNWQDTIHLGGASELSHSSVQQQILRLKETLHFTYGHVWRLFCKETLIDPTSQNFNFSHLDTILDFLVDADIIPYLDLGFRAKYLIFAPPNTADGIAVSEINVVPVTNLMQYQNLLTRFLRHCIVKYGYDNVEKWRFEISLPRNGAKPSVVDDFWFEVFANSFRCFKALLPHAAIGVNGLYAYDDNRFYKEYIARMARCPELPDFLGINIYPYSIEQERTLNTAASFDESFIIHKLQSLRKISEQYGVSHVPLYVTEWNSSNSCRNYLHDSIYKGTYIIKNVIDCIGKTDVFTYAGSLDFLYEYYDSTPMLCGAPGLISKNQICKPAFHAFSFLAHLKNQLLSIGENYIITKDDGNNYCIVCHNYCPPTMDYYYKYGESAPLDKVDSLFQSGSMELRFRLDHAAAGRYLVKKEYMNKMSGNLLAEWIHLGKPAVTTPDVESYLAAISIPRQTMEEAYSDNDVLTITTTLECNEFQMLQIIYLID